MHLYSFLELAILFSFLHVEVVSQQEKECNANGECYDVGVGKREDPVRQCGVFMAPSTLGEDTNMGIYTGKPLKTNDTINFPEIAIPLLFREWGDHKPGYFDGTLWDRYIWEGYIMEIETYDDKNRNDNRAVFVPGVGCTVNSVLDMNNIESTHGSVYDVVNLHRKRDPGAGGFTPYHESVTNAITDIEPGAELFANYGDYWIPDIPGAQVALNDVMDEAEDFLRGDIAPFLQESLDNDTLKEALWTFVREFPTKNHVKSVLPAKPWSEVNARIVELPQDKSVIRAFIRKQSIRDLEWLYKHGYCQDHIKPGPSTLPQAGKGAFATRSLPQGTVVGYSPLIHIGIYGREIWTIDYSFGKKYDLVINYSFGHANSSVVLTPYGGMVNYINHNREKANVRVRWPDKELVAHKPEYLSKTPEELRDIIEKIGLSFEYVALRDIEEGEEIFLDYGEEWEKAWNEHVTNWEPVDGADQYVHSSDWKETHFRTLKEQETNPYPSNLITMCHKSYSVEPDGTYNWVDVLRETKERVYCDILERSEETPHKYTVRLKMEDGIGSITVRNVKEESIYLYDKAFSGDWHLSNAFRHEIMIPDDIMPEAWLNGKPEQPF